MHDTSVVLFDLDGTIADSAPGVLAAMRHAFEVNGLPPLDEDTERGLLGPPFYESLPLLVDAARVPDIIAAYRERYRTTMYDAVVYPGVTAVLAALAASGRRVAIATSKPEIFATPIVEHLGLLTYLETVGGDTPDGGLPTKALVIEQVLHRLGDPPASDVTMVGDRKHDVLGARAHGIDCIAVSWGYALPGELAAAAPARVVATAADLAEVLGARTDGAGAGAGAH